MDAPNAKSRIVNDRKDSLILVVDDDALARDLVGDAVVALGYRYLTASDGVEALSLLSMHPIDLVVTDLVMPRMGGLKLIEKIRTTDAQIPIVIVTGEADLESARRAMRLNVSDYLLKPFENIGEVQAAIRRAIDTRSSRAEPNVLINELEDRVSPPTGQSTAKPDLDSEAPSGIVGGFEIIEKLGQGAMGAVFKARETITGQLVALKVVSPPQYHAKEHIVRFLSESRIVLRFNHPNLVVGIKAGRDGDYFYLAMDYIKGGTVREKLRRSSFIAEGEAAYIACQVTRALEHIWAVHLIHRDVKPDNILLVETDVNKPDSVKLADWGLSKQISQDETALTSTGAILGTPLYISPELVMGDEDIDIRSDIYSLGATLYHMVVGEPPFSGKTPADIVIKHKLEEAVPAHIKNAKVSRRTSSVIHKMMQKDPDARYTHPTQLLVDLIHVCHGENPEYARILDA